MSRITVNQTAARVGVSESLVYQWCQEKRLVHMRLGRAGRRGKILIDEADVDAFIAAAKVGVVAGHDPATAPTLRHISQ